MIGVLALGNKEELGREVGVNVEIEEFLRAPDALRDARGNQPKSGRNAAERGAQAGQAACLWKICGVCALLCN